MNCVGTCAGWVRLLSVVGIMWGGFALGQDANQIVKQMVANEDTAREHKQRYFYTGEERSERTGGHVWRERVAETTDGKVRLLLAEDGQTLSPERAAAERRRLAGIVADPRAFAASEHAVKGDEDKAKAMLDLLPKAFILQNARVVGDTTLVDFVPNPAYQTQSLEEKVLHGMAGTVTLETKGLRLRAIEAKLPKDVSVGLGLVNVHAGSGFATERVMVTPGQWKTSLIDTNINGRALLFKSLGKNEHAAWSEFKVLPFDMTVAQAVEMVER